MGLFDLFKKKSNNPQKLYKLTLLELYDLINENKYVNDELTKNLFQQAYELTRNNIIERHFLYNQLIDYYYGLRDKEEDALEICKKYCIESINHTPKFLQIDKNEHNRLHKDSNPKPKYIPPRIPAFQRLAIIYENEENYIDAIKVSEKAINLNLKDGTKSGFEGRISRLEKKMNKK